MLFRSINDSSDTLSRFISLIRADLQSDDISYTELGEECFSMSLANPDFLSQPSQI